MRAIIEGRVFEAASCASAPTGGDGILDLFLAFQPADLIGRLGLDRLRGGARVELLLAGSLFDGRRFSASDCVDLVTDGERVQAR